MEFSKSTFLQIIHVIFVVDSLLQKAKGQASCSGETDRFIKGRCYTYYNESLTWQEAKIRCEGRGQVLAAVDSMIQIKEMLSRQGIGTQVWIGASDIAEEGKFVWVHSNQTAGELVKLWEEDEPNDYGGDEDCVVVFVNFETNDVPCHFNYTYFCMETPKKASEDDKPFLSLQNIYIISAAGAAFLLLVLAIACIIVCRRKGLNTNHFY
ncbi:unnamed protein product [Lymnaea stagnalis]|uniref:C-type lectin domain-containing protein n=1 Tax=Lymnaea stagnalis TaxID=6523 RepID=A0AAV2HAD6_LYMST